ncbi:MAG: hypothetical protein HYW25_02025 [Candidatus Aenigmarchaeota archaeon]|nr:hypothetical protein [Candidatus Aenigmarchaeota archaeon]
MPDFDDETAERYAQAFSRILRRILGEIDKAPGGCLPGSCYDKILKKAVQKECPESTGLDHVVHWMLTDQCLSAERGAGSLINYSPSYSYRTYTYRLKDGKRKTRYRHRFKTSVTRNSPSADFETAVRGYVIHLFDTIAARKIREA